MSDDSLFPPGISDRPASCISPVVDGLGCTVGKARFYILDEIVGNLREEFLPLLRCEGSAYLLGLLFFIQPELRDWRVSKVVGVAFTLTEDEGSSVCEDAEEGRARGGVGLRWALALDLVLLLPLGFLYEIRRGGLVPSLYQNEGGVGF